MTILPGLRDLRAPLAAGLLWLVTLWLAIDPVLPDRKDAEGIELTLLRLNDFLPGELGLVSAVVFAAFLVGSVSTPLTSDAVARLPRKFSITGSVRIRRILLGLRPYGATGSAILSRLTGRAMMTLTAGLVKGRFWQR